MTRDSHAESEECNLPVQVSLNGGFDCLGGGGGGGGTGGT